LRESRLVGYSLIEAKAFLRPLPRLRTFTAHDESIDVGRFLAQFSECSKSELEELTLLGGRVLSPLPPHGALPARLAILVIPQAV
jgi:hypothetical protein